MIAKKYLKNFGKSCVKWTSTVSKAPSKPPSKLAPKFCEDFKEFYPKILNKALDESNYIKHPLVKDQIKKVCEHFMLCKFPIQAEFFMYSYELLEKPENITSEKLRQSYYIACAAELVQTYFLIHDDVYDSSNTRSGKLCWHLTPTASALGLNDTAMLRGFINELLKANLETSIYNNILDTINEMYMGLEMGQYMDLLIPAVKDYDDFTMENYEKITYFKSSAYAMNAPMQLALIMANKGSEEAIELVKHMGNNLGVLFQIHNDLTEFVGVDETLAMKSKTDIINGKCAWSAVKALQNFNPDQRKIFNECYRSSDPEKIRRIIQLYDEVNLVKLYREEEKQRYDLFKEKIRKLPPNSVPPPEFFENILKYFQSYASNVERFYYI